MGDRPLISIITITFNDLIGLKNTVESCEPCKEQFHGIEHIVIDGNSRDGTPKWLSSNYKSSRFRFLSEDDNGIYDAMNKGAYLAKGSYLLYLNSGDILSNDFQIDEVVAEIQRNEPDVLVGNALIIKNSGFKEFKRRPLKYLNFGMAFCHQAVFTKEEMFRGRQFSESYKIASDFKFYYELFQEGAVFSYLDTLVALVDGHGVSNTFKFESTLERYHVIKSKRGVTAVLRARFLYHLARSFLSDTYSRWFGGV